MWKIVTAVVLVFAITGLAVYVNSCPCERVPGLWLTGTEVAETQEDWSFVNEVGLCELEVRSWRAHSITLNCMSSRGDLFISCSRCEGKYWSGIALEHPRGVIRVDKSLYPITLRRLTESLELDRAWTARATKLRNLGREANDDRPDHWWSFRLESR